MEKAYKLKFTNEQSGELCLNTCGCSKTEPLHSFGPAVRPHYLIHYVLDGKGKFIIGKKEYPLEAGYGFLIEPDELTFYQADEFDPWTYIWVGFSGSQAGGYVRKMGLSEQYPIIHTEKTDELYAVVKDMIEHNTYSMSNELRRNGLLKMFLSIIAESVSITEKEDIDKANNYVQRAIEYIRSNYCNPIKVSDVASYVCINRSYLYTLFESSLKMSPQQFLTVYRITKATELLEVTGFSIESIAFSCGYNDPLVFTKAFRQMKGISPSKYRKEIIKTDKLCAKDNLEQIENFITNRHTK